MCREVGLVIQLVKPTLKYAEAIMAYRQVFIELGESMAGCGNLRGCTSAKEWIEGAEIFANGVTCPKDKVPSTTYLAVRLSDDKLVGVIELRHHINHPLLSIWGGHIGYSVHPEERRKGYAKEMLRQTLLKGKEHGLDKVLITCDDNHIGSQKTILANGGVFEKEVVVDGERVHRYWIELLKY